MRKTLLILLSALSLIACNKQSELVTIMRIDNVDWQKAPVASGAVLHVTVLAEAKSSPIQRIVISSEDVEYKNKDVLDSTLAWPLKNVNMSWYYALPYYQDTTKVVLTARSFDGSGNMMSYSITMLVAPGEEKLRTLDNMTLYSAASVGKSAFSLETLQPVYLNKDSATVAFYDVLDKTLQAPSCIWHSESGLLFSRTEGFNFSEASVQSLENVWPNLMKTSTIKDLKADDVLLIGKGDKAIGAIKILQIIDEQGTDLDRYIFSLKIRPNYKEEDKDKDKE